MATAAVNYLWSFIIKGQESEMGGERGGLVPYYSNGRFSVIRVERIHPTEHQSNTEVSVKVSGTGTQM